MNNQDKSKKELKARIKALEKRLNTSEASFMNVVGRSRDGILIVNASGQVVYANPAALQLFGMNIANLIGEPVGIPIEVNRTIEIDIVNRERGKINVEVSVVKIEWEGSEAFLSTLRDVSERKKAEAALAYMSRHDALTDLPNRRAFEDTLNRVIKQSSRSLSHSALLFLDLDRFKQVNDSLGHEAGDILLKHVAKVLQSCVRENDLVARLGGDEFAIILELIKNPTGASVVAQKIIDAISEPLEVNRNIIDIGISIGIAVYPFAGRDAETLTKNADAAMYGAKNSGRNQYKYFTPKLRDSSERELDIEKRLLTAINNKEFYMLYQPFIDLKSGNVVAIEALLRWRNDALGDVPTAEFLPIAEKLNLLNAIGCLTLDCACDEYLSHSLNNVLLCVNMSMRQLVNGSFTAHVMDKIQKHGMKPENFSLEITEGDIMSDPEKSINKLKILSEAGIRLLIDDYGTGYSSLSYLQKLPVNFLKIDQSFMKDVGMNNHNTLIVSSTIALAHKLGLKVIAEGVETEDQVRFLERNNCDYAQGFYFSEPVEMDKIQKMLESQ